MERNIESAEGLALRGAEAPRGARAPMASTSGLGVVRPQPCTGMNWQFSSERGTTDSGGAQLLSRSFVVVASLVGVVPGD